ncbi:MAG TPA: phenylalanine--tRNA ligase subunit beta, partial [Acidimicrobiia bacterium]|nr:phenylalanine--tRNA ligase subunit beta [Acidimicrobiia bacterium]
VDLTVPEPRPVRGGPPNTAPVEIDAPDRCPRYVALTGTVEMGSSPDWLARRLVLAGMRPISNVVDVTNYVMLERGQPLHAFDLDGLGGGGIRVRLARPDETLETLDGVERVLGPDDLLICDATDVPQALAGIMGGASAEVGAGTANVLLESAYFTPEWILRTSKRLALRTESSARFERGVDPAGALTAAERAWELLGQVAAGTAADEAVDVHPAPVERERIVVRPSRVNEVLGTEIEATAMERYLAALGMEIEAGGDDGALTVTVPTFRPDLEREIDLVEEVGRLHGYNAITRTLPRPKGQVGGLTPHQRERRLVRDALVGVGLCEAMNLALVAAADLERAGRPGVGIEVENPLRAEESILRPAVLPGLLRSVAFNAAHGLADTALFEVGHVFLPPPSGEVLPDEREHVAVALSGRVARRPYEPDRPVDVHDAKGVVEVLAETLELADWRLEPARRAGFHGGRCAALFVDGEEAGVVGEVDASVVAAMELPEPVVAVEVDLDRLLAGSRRDRRYRPISRYPASSIDLAFVVGSDIPAAHVEETLAGAAGELLESLELFDVFESAEALGEGRRSLAFRLRFRAPDRTLTDEEVGTMRKTCIDAVTSTHAATLRA